MPNYGYASEEGLELVELLGDDGKYKIIYKRAEGKNAGPEDKLILLLFHVHKL